MLPITQSSSSLLLAWMPEKHKLKIPPMTGTRSRTRSLPATLNLYCGGIDGLPVVVVELLLLGVELVWRVADAGVFGMRGPMSK